MPIHFGLVPPHILPRCLPSSTGFCFHSVVVLARKTTESLPVGLTKWFLGEFYPTIKEGHDAHVVGQFSSSQNPHVDQSGWIRNFVNYYLPAIPISKPDNDEIILRDAHQVLPKALVQIRFE
jgi:hypothetical protein